MWIITFIEEIELIRTKFFVRGKAGVESTWGPSTDSSEKSQIQIDESFGRPPADIIEVSKDGKYIALVNREAGEFSIRETERYEFYFPNLRSVVTKKMGHHIIMFMSVRNKHFKFLIQGFKAVISRQNHLGLLRGNGLKKIQLKVNQKWPCIDLTCTLTYVCISQTKEILLFGMLKMEVSSLDFTKKYYQRRYVY